jgi:hypothetical protein
MDALKVELYIEKPPQQVATFLFTHWNGLVKDIVGDFLEFSEIIHTFTDTAVVFKDKFISPIGLIEPRVKAEFHVNVNTDENTFANIITTVDVDIGENPGCTKADTKYHIHICEPVGEDKTRTHLIAVLLSDPKGNIPAAVTNVVLQKRVTLYCKLKDILAEI